MKAMWWAVACFGTILCPGAARADMGFPGFKFRELRVVIDNLDDYPDHDFYLVAAEWLNPAEGESGPERHLNPERERMTPGRPHLPGYPARFMHNWMLVAVGRLRTKQADRLGWKMLAADAPGVSRSNRVSLSQPPSVLVFNPNDYEVHHFHVTLADGQLTLTPGPVESGSDGFRSWLPGLLAATAVTGLGFLVVRRLRRPRRPPAVPAGDQ